MKEYENKVELIGHYGGDESHALSAWTSTSRDLTDDKRARMGKLLNMLASEGHHTPFEKSTLHFLLTTDIASHIHILKHRVGVSVNGESARYKELKDDKFFIPQDWDQDEQAKLVKHCEESMQRYHECLASLVAKGVPRKRAKESARFYLPYATQLTCDVSFNFRSFAHFVGLRHKDNAQVEIYDIADKMLVEVRKLDNFKLTLEAFKL